ncbi:MAG: transcriptional regulator NrdR [Spirochaetes bacterium]|nr:transcriptional regulator NrdR [Spirochaetota bacterium]
MLCPYCGTLEDKVIETRQNTSGTAIRRRRECLSCKYRFTSYEQIEEKKLMVIKKDGSREPFDIAKITRGLEKSLEKRPVSTETTEDMLQAIEDEAYMIGKNSREITAGEVGDLVLKHLFNVDKVAYVRFASVYRMFNNVNEFISEIENFTVKQGKKKEK